MASKADVQAKLTSAINTLEAANAEVAQLSDPTTTQPAPTPTPTPTPSPTATPVPVGAIKFSDDFSGTTLDSTKWANKSGKAGNGAGYWDATRAKLDGNGNLVITAELVSGVWHTAFISGKEMITGPRYIETLAKCAKGAGAFGAPSWEWDFPYGAGGLEVDVCEQLGDQADDYHFTLHNWDKGTQKSYRISTGVVLSAGFHRFGTAVYADHADAYFDGKKMATILASDIGFADLTSHEVCENIDLNMGGWGGTISGTGTFVQYTNYLKVWALA